ncbi:MULTISPECIES: transglycosylase SLT domain-containing protein [Streptacidiphilus]|uniref:Transglycosylase SLT domain-containing protein n=1 Tax=Streptacidiphilus cavernicola TaxID=3342716 RepID=A0ABV6UHN1_9ACTN|nr:transglycosylase SLT domain-containing protein [Streptacidiphilus jeojiense]
MPGEQRKSRWGWFLVLAAVVVIGWIARPGGHDSGTAAAAPSQSAPAGSASRSASEAPSGSASAPETGVVQPYDPAHYAADTVRYGRQAGIDPQLLMAILYNESYKPHDAASERAWQKLKPGASFGIANMHEAAFDETKQGRSFADRSWTELPDHPDLAIEAEAWFLHDLRTQLPAQHTGSLTQDELLALGYNTGASNMRAFARGVKLGSMAQSYLDTLRQNWDKAGRAVASATSG